MAIISKFSFPLSLFGTSLLVVFAVALLCGHSNGFESTSSDFNIRQRLATKTPYWSSNDFKDPEVPKNCRAEPVHVNLLARHGSRYPEDGDINNFYTLQTTLQQNGKYITNPQFDWMKTWQTPYTASIAGLLNSNGAEEHYNLSKRIQKAVYPVLSQAYSPVAYPIQATQVSRASMSGNSFGYGLFEETGQLGSSKYTPFYIYTESTDDDLSLRFFDNCPSYTLNVEDNSDLSYDSTQYLAVNMDNIISKVSSRLGLPPNSWNLTSSDVKTMYKGCAFDIGVDNITDMFCALFDEDDIEVFEYSSDLDDYYANGYGYDLSYQISCPLLNDFFYVMDDFINGTNTELKSKLRFAHAETVMPFIALLGLFDDSEPLHWNSSQSTIDNRQWRTSRIAPFASNIAFVLYDCDDGYRVKLMHNEEEYEFPGCGEMYCPYERVQQIYSAVSYDNCDFSTLCSLPPSPPPAVNPISVH